MRNSPKSIAIWFGLLLLILSDGTFLVSTPIFRPSISGAQFEYIKILCWELTTGQATFYATVSGAIFTGVGFFATIFSLTSSMEDRRKERAHAMAAEWNSKEIRENCKIVKRLFPKLKELRSETDSGLKIFDFINQNEDRKEATINLLNILEDWAIGIHANYFDEEVLELSMCNVFETYFNELKEFVYQARKHFNEPDYYIQLEKYVKKMELKKQAS